MFDEKYLNTILEANKPRLTTKPIAGFKVNSKEKFLSLLSTSKKKAEAEHLLFGLEN